MRPTFDRSVLWFAALAASLTLGCSKKSDSQAQSPTTTEPSSAALTKEPAAPTTPGVTATEIKVGQTMPYSGPASAYGIVGKVELAYVKMINDKGGINGRKVNLISLDDGYSPPKTMEQTRKLIEDDEVAFIFGTIGTPGNLAIRPYLNEKKVPHLVVTSGSDHWANFKEFPWTMGWQPSYHTEATIYARYLLKEKPDAKVCVLYQNDDFGKEFLAGLRNGFGDKHDATVVKTLSYEVADPSIDSSIIQLQDAKCDTLMTAATPKFVAQAIRKVHDIRWKPLHFLSYVASSRAGALTAAGLDKSKGIIAGQYLLDPADPALANDPGLVAFREFLTKYAPDVDPGNELALSAYAMGQTLEMILRQAGDDLSRENIMKQATSMNNVVVNVALPGTALATSTTDYRPFEKMQLGRFNGQFYERFGELVSAE